MKDALSPQSLSWSERLFLRINALVGVSKPRDSFMYFCAHWLVYLHVAACMMWAVSTLLRDQSTAFYAWLFLTSVSFVCSLIVSYGIALLWRHNRPVIEFPNIKSLLTPMFTWKSFPSDHTITVTVFTLAAGLFSPTPWFLGPLIVSTVLVPLGRVYVGVHYPRDILGGLTVGILCTMAAYRVLVL